MAIREIRVTTRMRGYGVRSSLAGTLYGSEALAHKFIVTDEDGGSFSGTVTAKFVRMADDVTVPLVGSTEGGAATVTLTSNCYLKPGRFLMTIFVTENGSTTEVYSCSGNVALTDGETTVDPSGEIALDVSTLIANIDAAVASIPADYTALQKSVVDSTGNAGIVFSNPTLKQYIVTNGTTVQWSTPSTSSVTNIKWAVVECSEGDAFTITGKGGNADRLWAFADSSKNILLASTPNAELTNGIIYAPANAAYLIINDEINKASYIGIYAGKTANDALKASGDVLTAFEDTGELSIENVTGTAKPSVALYNGALVTTSSWTEGSKYSIEQYSVDTTKCYRIKNAQSGWIAFSNYAYSSEMPIYGLRQNLDRVEYVRPQYNYMFIATATGTVGQIPVEVECITVIPGAELYYQKSKLNIGRKRIVVAASDASESDKMIADYVCDGVNDEVQIQAALDSIIDSTGGDVLLTVGTFYIDNFITRGGKRLALSMAGQGTGIWYKSIIGSGKRPNDYSRTRIIVTSTALTALGTDDGVVFGTPSFVYGRTGVFKDFQLYMGDNQHKVTVIDNSQFSAGCCENLTIAGVMPSIANTDDIPMPNANCIGITGYSGDDSGTLNKMTDVFVVGFYEGFRLGGEHLVCTNLGARFNYYSYTFGNYDWHIGTLSHPITMINCCDEHSACLPKFVRSGDYSESAQKTKMQVDMIGFNMELIRPANFGGGTVDGAEVVNPGAFCGRIEFTAYGTPNGGTQEWPATTNQRAVKFWKDGSGEDFITRNMAHAQAGTTTERDSYYPMYMQQYFDTTLNKMLVYNGSAWVDMSGQTV